jgi:TBC1 domain family protein 5
VKNRFQSLPFKCNLQRYIEDPVKPTQPSEVQAACNRIFRTLGAVDAPMHAHLTQLGVEPQLFLLRWLRVLFSREFHLDGRGLSLA